MLIGRLIILLSLIVLFCCNNDSKKSNTKYINVYDLLNNGKQTITIDSTLSNNSNVVDTVKSNQNTNFRSYPEGKKLQVSFEHEMSYEREIVIAKHWHKSNNKWYVILLDGRELYCDDVREIE